MSNEHDEVSGDGQEPAGGAASGEDATSSSAGTSTPGADLTSPLEASGRRTKARKAPATGDSSGAEPAGSSVAATSGATPADSESEGPATVDSDGNTAAEDSAKADKAALVVTEAATSGAVSSGAARAAARRSAARAGVSETKGAATPRRADKTTTKRPNMFARFGRFLREVVAELRKVIWPSRNQMVTYTIVVIVFVAFMVALVAGLDLLFAKGVLAVFG